MKWECSECGAKFERWRPPHVCSSCGMAGVHFVEAEAGLEGDLDADSLYAAWIRRGVEGDLWRSRRRGPKRFRRAAD